MSQLELFLPGPKAARRIAYLGLGTLLLWAFKQVFDLYYLWQMRIVERAHLAALDERLWRDAGLDAAQVRAEVSKPFWRA